MYTPTQSEQCRVIILDSPEEVHAYQADGRMPAACHLFGPYWV
jgi:hypothetical protein